MFPMLDPHSFVGFQTSPKIGDLNGQKQAVFIIHKAAVLENYNDISKL